MHEQTSAERGSFAGDGMNVETAASSQPHHTDGTAIESAERHPHEASLAEAKRTLALRTAEMEHARRQNGCLRTYSDLILQKASQPCLVISRTGRILLWNEALSHSSGVSEMNLLNQPVESALSIPMQKVLDLHLWHDPVERSNVILFNPYTVTGTISVCGSLIAEKIHLLPLLHIPGCVEAVAILIE